jgi:hypothetical protein
MEVMEEILQELMLNDEPARWSGVWKIKPSGS